MVCKDLSQSASRPLVLSAVTSKEQEVLHFDDVHFISFYFTDHAIDVTAAQSSSNQS